MRAVEWSSGNVSDCEHYESRVRIPARMSLKFCHNLQRHCTNNSRNDKNLQVGKMTSYSSTHFSPHQHITTVGVAWKFGEGGASSGVVLVICPRFKITRSVPK
ncbi:hypothetical protein AVEN_83815-1 [Araneus ventricosus]|uniref:Uncharacterized protein n=1 Tax=Araneus ventricosus TaxID=182803 RepID=A0A4Y2SYP9_ARAVE|nr:hypothetical protein AVEN_83815-1 [Araneus ventricosus]